MKILFAYDGSDCAQAASRELLRAGLPPEAETLVLTVAEPRWPPLSTLKAAVAETPRTPEEREMAALHLAQQAATSLAADFPAWQIISRATSGAPAVQINQTASEWKADLIVIGSHGWGALERLAFGSVSLKVLHDAPCSVRIARQWERLSSNVPLRLVVGVDGSGDAREAVEEIARRYWPPSTEVRLVTAVGAPDWQTGLPFETVRTQARELQQEAENRLAQAGLSVSSTMNQIYASDLLLEEAERWKADCIFVGTRGRSLLGRMLIGSVSSAVAAKAGCSVEIVRRPQA